jgi:hypothetical protein
MLLLTGLKVLSPASICHLPGQQEIAGPGHLCTGNPVEIRRLKTPFQGEHPTLAVGRGLQM